MSQRKVVRTDAALSVPGNGDAADISSAPRPGRTAIGAQTFVVGLGIERDHTDAAQIGQTARRLPVGHEIGPQDGVNSTAAAVKQRQQNSLRRYGVGLASSEPSDGGSLKFSGSSKPNSASRSSVRIQASHISSTIVKVAART